MTDEKFDKRMQDWAERETNAAPDLRPTTEMYRLVESKGKRTWSFWNQPRWVASAGVILTAFILLVVGGLILGDPAAWFRPETIQQTAFVEVREGIVIHPEAPEKGKGKGEPSFQQLIFQVHRQADGKIESLDIRESIAKPIHLTNRDDFRLLVQPAQPRYLYIYLVNPSGDYQALHPENGFNPLHPVIRTVLPKQPDWFYLSGESGTYDLRLVTASDEIPELDELYDQYMQRVSEPDAESARNNFIEFLESIITDRSRDLEVWELTLILKD
jgi:hypothetical protein